jgi:tRNA(Ser,Leu) C12 N-acetylase TAN1
LKKSENEFDKYKIVQEEIEKELNLKEIEEDIKKLLNSN